MLRFRPALSRLGDGVRLPNLLAEILRRRNSRPRRIRHCHGGGRSRRGGGDGGGERSNGRNGHTIRIQEISVRRIRVSRDHGKIGGEILGGFCVYSTFLIVEKAVYREMWRKTAEIYIIYTYRSICVAQ